MSNWNKLNSCRIGPAEDQIYGTTEKDGFNGFFCLVLNGLRIKCIASDGESWQHVSVSIEGSTLPPSWSVMCQVKDLFFESDDWVVQFHPAESEYVNQHPGVLHLWKPIDQELPTPNRLMVGPKNESDLEIIMKDERLPLLQRLGTKALFLRNRRLGKEGC